MKDLEILSALVLLAFFIRIFVLIVSSGIDLFVDESEKDWIIRGRTFLDDMRGVWWMMFLENFAIIGSVYLIISYLSK